MTRSKGLLPVGFPLLLIVGTAVFLFFSNQEGFTGSRVKNPDAYTENEDGGVTAHILLPLKEEMR